MQYRIDFSDGGTAEIEADDVRVLGMGVGAGQTVTFVEVTLGEKVIARYNWNFVIAILPDYNGTCPTCESDHPDVRLAEQNDADDAADVCRDLWHPINEKKS